MKQEKPIPGKLYKLFKKEKDIFEDALEEKYYDYITFTYQMLFNMEKPILFVKFKEPAYGHEYCEVLLANGKKLILDHTVVNFQLFKNEKINSR